MLFLWLYNMPKRETNISNKQKLLENANWQKADRLAIYSTKPIGKTRGAQGQRSSTVEDLNLGSPDYKSSALSTRPCRLLWYNQCFVSFFSLQGCVWVSRSLCALSSPLCITAQRLSDSPTPDTFWEELFLEERGRSMKREAMVTS